MKEISVIIATYNRGSKLVRTLSSLAGLSLDPHRWEAIVINNNSTDDTEEVFREFAGMHPHLDIKMVVETRQGLSHARNRGIAESTGNLIAIIDDDEEVNPGFLTAYIDLFANNPQAWAAGGRIAAEYEIPKPQWLSPIVERPIGGILDMGSQVREFGRRRYPGGGNMCLSRKAVQKVGLFNPELGRTGKELLAGEEKDLLNRIRSAGGKIYYTPHAVITHLIPAERLTLDYLRRVSFMIGRSERIRTLGSSGKGVFYKRVLGEIIRWCATFLIGSWYFLTGRGQKARGLFILRRQISKGFFEKNNP